jgi:hypothetical protein
LNLAEDFEGWLEMEKGNDSERVHKKIRLGKDMCSVAEDILMVSEIEKYCDVLKLAIKNWRKQEALAQEASYEEVMAAGNELYKLLHQATENFNLSEEDRKKVGHLMSLWFDSLTLEESQHLIDYINLNPYNYD